MAIRTKEDLIDKISQDHVWRIREIAELKNLVQQPSISDLTKRVLCRSGLALLYAHWEGFVKKAGSFFLEYVAMQRLLLSELNVNFVTLVVKSKFEKASESKKSSSFQEVVKFILENQNTRAKIPFKNIVDTQSNLSTTVLKEIIWCLGVDYSKFETKENLIDMKLVNKRNFIAHGEIFDVSIHDFLDMADEVIGLMNLFKNEIENSVISDEYKK